MLTSRWGVVGNPHTGYPDRVYFQKVKPGWLRALVLDDGSWAGMLNQVPVEVNVAAVITGQSGPLANDFWSEGWQDRFEEYITAFCEAHYRKVRLIEFTNEWDMWNNSDRAEKAAEIAMRGTMICKNYGILGVLGSVASGTWKEQLAQAIAVVDRAEHTLGHKAIHGFAFHPYVSYVKRDQRMGDPGFIVPTDGDGPSDGWERLHEKVREAISIAGNRPCAVTEVGIKVGDAGGPEQQATYVHGVFQDELSRLTPDELLMATYFCWCDQNGAPDERGDAAFGLRAEDGSIRPAFNAAAYQFQNAPIQDVPVERLIRESFPKHEEPPIDPPPDKPPATRTMTASEAHSVRWRAIAPTAVYNSDFGFERHWRKPENAWWGSPITEAEYTLDDGRPLRIFANAVVAYNGDDTVEILE